MDIKFISPNHIGYVSSKRFLCFDDVSIATNFTSLDGPDDSRIDLTTRLGQYHVLKNPIIGIPLDRKYNREWVFSINRIGGIGIIDSSAFSNIESLNDEIKLLHESKVTIGFSIGVNIKDLDIITYILSNNPSLSKPIIFIKTPNGDSQNLIEQIRRCKLKFGDSVVIVAGFIETPIGLQRAILSGASSIVCEASKNSSITTILNLRRTLSGLQSNANLIVYSYGNAGKCIVAGADIIADKYLSLCKEFEPTKEYLRSSLELCNHSISDVRNVLFITNSKNTSDCYNNSLFQEHSESNE